MHSDGASLTYRERIVAWRKGQRESARRERIGEARRIVEGAARQFTFRRMYLFGSTVRSGALSVWSDLDFAVEGLPREAFFGLLGYLAGQTRFEVDLKPLESLPTDMQKRIRANGLVLHER